MDIFDSAGRKITRLVDAVQEPGPHEARWDGRNGNGTSVASGIYFCRLNAAKCSIAKKMVLLR
jgi:flagellar hook assembly protein FlgD